MPLTRYEIRNEYSLANPDLYRAAAKDDPEGLLEGVAMAGLVGIVRQLGDLAEFAAEVFHDLHEEVLATAARGHELLIRVQQLEAELPLVEKIMFAQINYVNFAYNPGVEWHASIRNDQNHFTQGDLPRFIRNAYEDCRGPPRLSVLDRFDVAGAGACLKRYTDPSFFKMEWASSELMKAEKEQQDKKARRIKKKCRRQRNGEMREAIFTANIQPRLRNPPLEVENIASTSVPSSILISCRSSDQEGLGPAIRGVEHMQTSSRFLIPDQEIPELKQETSILLEQESFNILESPEHNEASLEPSEEPSKVDADKLEGAGRLACYSDVIVQKEDLQTDLQTSEDFASETDNFMDALTTMDSEVETDSEMKTFVEVDVEYGPDLKQIASDHVEEVGGDDLVPVEHPASSLSTPEESNVVEIVEPVHVVDSPHEEKRSTFVHDGSGSVSPSIEYSSGASTPVSRGVASSSGLAKSAVLKFDEYVDSESLEEVPETPETPEANESVNLQLESLSSAFHQLSEPVVPLGNGTQSGISKQLGSLSFHSATKPGVLLGREILTTDGQKNSFEDSESEASDGLKESSPLSSANSSIQPMRWTRDFSSPPTHAPDSDDELDGMQVSSSSPSSSSSTLSSPRPSTLATMVFNLEFEKKSVSPLSPSGSLKSSESLLGMSPHSVGRTAPHSPIAHMEISANSSMTSFHPLTTSSFIYVSSTQSDLPALESSLHCSAHKETAAPSQDQGLVVVEFDHFPPPPPLPPLEWRMSRRFNGILPSSSKASTNTSIPPVVPQNFLSGRRERAQGFIPPMASPPAARKDFGIRSDQSVQTFKPSNTGHQDSQEFSVSLGEVQESSESPTTVAPVPQTLPVVVKKFSQDCKPFTAEFPTPSPIPLRSSDLAQPFKASSIQFPTSHKVQVHLPDDSICNEHSASGSSSVRPSEPVQAFKPCVPECINEDQEDLPRFSVETYLQGSSLLMSPLETQGSGALAGVASKISTDNSDEDDGEENITSPAMLEASENVTFPAMLEALEKDMRPITKDGVESTRLPSQGTGPVQVPRPPIFSKIERKDSLIAAIASHDRSTLKKVPEWSQSSRTPHSDDREVLLEQIRTGSFSLRRTKIEKQDPPRPVASINVAAILEKANAIRQAFAGSDDEDEDDDWSDA